MTKTMSLSYSQYKQTIIENTEVNVQSTVIEKKKRLVYKLSSQKRAVILNNIGFETGFSFEIVSQCKYSSYDKNNVVENITVNISRQSLKTPMLMYRVQ